mmetsp:Transcript_58984/g.129253  ORF Transcript_58984/g.129253 Transcript_58984/m.129253 type:complete len:623 (+) Transcript_58984:41-1909(+)
MTEAQEATPTMGEESAPKKDEMPSGPWADEGQGPQGDGDAPEVVWQDDEAVPTQQEPAQETPGPNLEAPNLNLEGGQPDGQPSDKGALEVPAHQGSQGSQGEVAATSPELLTQETSAPPRQGSVTSAKPQDVPFTSALPPSEPTSPQESQDGQKDEAPVSTPAVTIDVDSVKAVPTTKGDAKRSSESKKSEGRRGSLGSYRAETLLYDRLGVEPTATDAEIRNAYKRMALQLHPDKGGDPENFKLMREAYEVLSNHQKRTVYDLHGMEGIKCMEQAAQMEARMSDVTPVLLIMMELAQTNALMRGIVVAIATLLGSMVVLPFILLTLKWDGDTSFSWAVVFIPVWIFQLVILCCQHVFLSMQQLGAPDEEDPEAARTHTKLKKEVRLLRFQSCVTHALLISFEILLILRLEGVMTALWVVVISPWLALEVWWFLFRLYVSPVAWALSDPQAATEAGAAQAEVKRTPLFWLFLVGYLQAGFFRFLTSILISARANADGHPHAVSWWLVFLPLYFSVALFVAIPCLERVVKRRRQGLLRQEEDNPGPVAAKGCVATVWLMMLWLAAGKFDGGAYSAAWVFSPIFFFVSLAVCIVGMVIILARPQHFQRAAESMGEPIGKPAETE